MIQTFGGLSKCCTCSFSKASNVLPMGLQHLWIKVLVSARSNGMLQDLTVRFWAAWKGKIGSPLKRGSFGGCDRMGP